MMCVSRPAAGEVRLFWAGAAYGLGAIPVAWRAVLHGDWPLRSGSRWDEVRLITLADRLAESPRQQVPR